MRKAVFKSTSTLCSISALATALALASPAVAQVVIDDEQTGTVDLDDDEATLEVDADGSLIVDGDDAVEVNGNEVSITNDGIIRSIGDRAIDGRDVTFITITNSGTIEGAEDAGEGGSDVIDVSGSEGVTITNTGSIIAGATDTKAIDGGNDVTVVNSGVIRSLNGEGRGIEGDDNLVITNLEGGVIEALGDGAEAIESDGIGLTIVNDGLIRSEFDDAIDGGADVDITNNATGIIRGANNDGLELDNGVIVNAGLIESLSSDPDGDFILDAEGNPTEDREIDAGIDFDGSDDPEANMDGMVTNLAGGIIRGDIGINTSSGATGSAANTGSQTIVNFGTIEGRAVNPETGRIDAVLLGAGDDEFQQWQTGVTIGVVDGGSGTDAAIFGNDSDEDATRDVGDIAENFVGFESFTLLATGEGNFVLTGDGDVAFTVAGGDVTVEGALGGTLTFDGGTNLSVTGTEVEGEVEGETEIVPAAISVAAGDAVVVNVDDFTITNDGTIEATDGRAIEAGDVAGLTITNNGTIEASDRAINAGDGVTIINNEGALINTTGDADTIQTGDNLTIVNNGTISNEGFDTKIIDAGDGLTVTNNGTITSDWKGVEGEADFTLTNNEGALIFSAFDEAVEADGPGLTVVNDGEIIAPKDDAIDGGADVTIINTGLIRGGENDGLELDNGTITNSGIIESLSSDPEGDFILDADGNPTEDREIDAGIDFDGSDDPEASEDGMVTNLAGGIIRGDIGINTSSGATGSNANEGSQTIVNFGTIEGRAVNPETGRIDAVLLGAGDDEFQQWQTGVTIGTVDGGTGDDTAIFGNDSDEDVTRDLTDIAANFVGFETFALLGTGAGGFVLTGEGDIAFNVLGGDVTVDDGTLGGTLTFDVGADLTVTDTGAIIVADGRAVEAGDADGMTIVNSGTIEASDRAINLGDDATITNNEGALINTTGDADTIQTGDNLTIVNNGTISNEGFDTKIIDAGDGLTVTNNGTITSDWKGVEGEADFTLTNNEGALIFSALDEAVEADGPGLTVVNDGEIIAPKDDAIDGGADVTIINTGLIRGGENDGLELDNGTITNSGIIESLSSDPEGDFSDIGLTNRELDAGIDFDGTGDPDANEDGLVTNLAGGIIRGDIGINASSGNFVADDDGMAVAGSAANFGDQTVVNFGTIEGRLVNPVTGRIDAVLLSFGDDEFQQWTGAVVNGWIDLEAGDDTFILEGASSSVSGSISGGEGNDTAILAGVLDSDNIVGFETIQLGSTLGDTLNDLDISGARTITGDILHVGTVNVDLGVDSLTTTGTITLTETGVLNIATPLGPQLVGETVVVLGGTGVVNQGATVNIVEDDFLLDYSLVAGNSVSVLVNAINPLAGNADANLAAIGGAIAAGANAGTFGGDQFASLNALGNAADYAAVLNDALPSLSDGVAREVFETGSLATQALDRHLAAESSGVWGQIAVRGAEQDARSATVDGYESDQLVFTLGADILAVENLNIGVLASYANIDLDDRTIGDTLANAQEVESFRIGAYAAVTVFDRGFFNAELSYLTGEVESSRNGRLGQITSSYDLDGVAGRATFGYDLLGGENVTFTPTVGINFATINFDDAVESGGYGLLVQRDDAEFFEARFGAELTGSFSEFVRGYLHGTYVKDLSDEAEPVTLSSAQLPTFTVLPALREEDRFEVGAGVTFMLGETFGIDVGYLGDFADGYDGHAARVSARFAF